MRGLSLVVAKFPNLKLNHLWVHYPSLETKERSLSNPNMERKRLWLPKLSRKEIVLPRSSLRTAVREKTLQLILQMNWCGLILRRRCEAWSESYWNLSWKYRSQIGRACSSSNKTITVRMIELQTLKKLSLIRLLITKKLFLRKWQERSNRTKFSWRQK